MPSKTSAKPAYQRWLQRRAWARERGCKDAVANLLASRIGEFRAFVRSEGLNPDSLGDFAQAFARKDRLREVQP